MSRHTHQKDRARQAERIGAKVSKTITGGIRFAFNRTYSTNPTAPAETPAEHRARMDAKHRRSERLKREQARLMERLVAAHKAEGLPVEILPVAPGRGIRASKRSLAELAMLVAQAEKSAARKAQPSPEAA